MSYRPRHRLPKQGRKLQTWRRITFPVSCVLVAVLLATVVAVTRLSPHPGTGMLRSGADLAEHPAVNRQVIDSKPEAGAGHKPLRVSIGTEIAAFARRYATGLNHPYMTGWTSSASGWDCTYFAAFVWRHFGFDAVPGFEYGTHYFDTNSLWLSQTSKTASPQPGALVFEAGADGTVADPGHVGVLVSVHPLLMVAAADSAQGTIYEVPQQVSGYKIPAGGWLGLIRYW